MGEEHLSDWRNLETATASELAGGPPERLAMASPG